MISRILLDMDGVLADFVGGAAIACDKTHVTLRYGQYDIWKAWGLTEQQFWQICRGHDFWANLPLTREANDIVAILERSMPATYLFSCPSDDPGSYSGKYAWIEKHFPQFKRRLLFSPCKMDFCGRGDLLIDDSDRNVESALQCGAEAILLPREWNKLHMKAGSENSVIQRLFDRLPLWMTDDYSLIEPRSVVVGK